MHRHTGSHRGLHDFWPRRRRVGVGQTLLRPRTQKPGDLSITQNLNLYGQLASGVRRFDLRPKELGGHLYIHHSQAGIRTLNRTIRRMAARHSRTLRSGPNRWRLRPGTGESYHLGSSHLMPAARSGASPLRARRSTKCWPTYAGSWLTITVNSSSSASGPIGPAGRATNSMAPITRSWSPPLSRNCSRGCSPRVCCRRQKVQREGTADGRRLPDLIADQGVSSSPLVAARLFSPIRPWSVAGRRRLCLRGIREFR